MNTDTILRVLKNRASILECARLRRFSGAVCVQKRQRAAAVQNLAVFRAVFESVSIRVHPWLAKL